MNIINILYLLIISKILQCQLPYIGGNDPNFLINNPSQIKDLLKDIKGKVPEACEVIPGIGYAVLSIRQLQQAIESHFENRTNDSFIKIIFFKEFANPVTKQLLYKTVFYIKTFTTDIYIGIEAIYKPQGYPSFEIMSYIMDQDLDNIKLILKDQSIDPDQIYACGDLQEIFNNKQQIQIVVEEQQQQYQQGQQQDTNIYYDGHPRDIKPDPLQPLNLASTRRNRDNSNDPKYYGIDN